MYHILFISYDGLTDPLGQSQILPYLCRLTEYGYRFTIISCEKSDRFQRHSARIESLLSGLPIRWEPLKYHKQPPVLSAIYDLQKIKQRAARIHRQDPIDMVHTRSGTPALAGMWLKKKFGIRFLNDVRDFYSQSRIDSGQWPQNKLIYRKVFQYFDRKEKLELSLSDGIVCLTHKAKQILRDSKYYKTGTPLQVIPCSVDMELFNPESLESSQAKQLKNQFGINESDLIYSYLGSVGTWYLAKEMFSLFKKLNKENQSSKLLVISPDDKQTILDIALAAGVQPDNIIITSANRQDVPVLLSLSQYSIFFIKPCYSKQASSPTKLGEIMAMGIPVITNDGIGDVTDIVEKSNAGIVLKELNESSYDLATQDLKKKIYDRKSIRQAALEHYDLEKAVENYRSIYDNILKEHPVYRTNENVAIKNSEIAAST